MKKHLVLVGFMGCGKSTIGKLLAEQLEMPFIDSDALIETEQQMTVSEIFASKGEAAFREMERQFCANLSAMPATVIAVGGGLPCYFDNLEVLKANGKVIYINASLQTITKRLKQEREHRPLIQHLTDNELFPFVEEKLTERKDFYKKADIIMPNELDKPEKVIEKLLKAL